MFIGRGIKRNGFVVLNCCKFIKIMAFLPVEISFHTSLLHNLSVDYVHEFKLNEIKNIALEVIQMSLNENLSYAGQISTVFSEIVR